MVAGVISDESQQIGRVGRHGLESCLKVFRHSGELVREERKVQGKGQAAGLMWSEGEICST